MILLVLTLILMLAAVLAMAIGVMISGRRLQGSCGGLASGSCACRDQGLAEGAACPRVSKPSEALYQVGVRPSTSESRDRASPAARPSPGRR
jgi:hypothetical protein